MDLEEPFQRAVDLLSASSDVWQSAEMAKVFPDGLERVASAFVATIGVDEVEWIETRADLDAPKAEAVVISGRLYAHLMLTGEGFGFVVSDLKVVSLRATSTPRVHPNKGEPEPPFRFTATFERLEIAFPWDADNTKQDAYIHEQFGRLLARLR